MSSLTATAGRLCAGSCITGLVTNKIRQREHPVNFFVVFAKSLRKSSALSETNILRGYSQPVSTLVRQPPCQRMTRRTIDAPSRRRKAIRSSVEYDSLEGLPVVKATSGQSVELLSLWKAEPGTRVAVAFLTHFADLSSWEFAQKLLKKLPALQADGVQIIAVGLGSMDNARRFSETLNFPLELLYADSSGACYRALNFSPGIAPEAAISPYLKLLPMLMGIGSPGTIQEVARGYLGDGGSKPVFDRPTPFDVLGKGYQRPMELATLRLFNMIGILQKWGEMSPPETRLLTQQGGALVFNGKDVLFKHVDSGILKYTDVDAFVDSALQKKLATAKSTVT